MDQMQFLFVSQSEEAPAAKVKLEKRQTKNNSQKNHEKLSDPRARSFWISSFGAQARMVPWSEFCHVMTVASGSAKLDSREVFFFVYSFFSLKF